jgi:hypothetical protein
VSNGVLSKKTSLDLLEDLDFHFLQQPGLDQEGPVEGSAMATPSHASQGSLGVVSSMASAPGSFRRRDTDLSLDDIEFDEFDNDEPAADRRDRSGSICSVNSMSGKVKIIISSSSSVDISCKFLILFWTILGFGVNGSNISPSMLGQNFPDVFDDENRLSSGSNGGRPNTRPSTRRNVLTISASACSPSNPIDIPNRKQNQAASVVREKVLSSLVCFFSVFVFSYAFITYYVSFSSINTQEGNSPQDRIGEFDNLDALNDTEDGPHFVGAYSPESRRRRVARFLEKRGRRIWTKKVKYDVRKNFADSRMRVKGRFVRKEDEELLRDLLSLT